MVCKSCGRDDHQRPTNTKCPNFRPCPECGATQHRSQKSQLCPKFLKRVRNPDCNGLSNSIIGTLCEVVMHE